MAAIHYIERPFEGPAPDLLLVVVKTYNCDFEVVLSLSKTNPPLTLGTNGSFKNALEMAQDAARKFDIDRVYVIGVTNALEDAGDSMPALGTLQK